MRIALCLFVLLLSLSSVDALGQRGGRSRDTRSGERDRNSLEGRKFVDRLWYGASGNLSYNANDFYNQFFLGLQPMVGYKLNEYFSVGPRIGVTWTGIKGETDAGDRQRANLWDFSAGVFARGRYRMFYGHVEASGISRARAFLTTRGLIETDNLEPRVERLGDSELLVGIGYNPSLGSGLSSDIGIYYDLFNDVNDFASPIQFRVMLTWNY